MRLQHQQVQRLCQAVSIQPALGASSTTTSDAGMLVTPPLLTGASAAQLHNIAGQPPTSSAFCPNIVVAASLDTAPTLQTPSAGTLGTAGSDSEDMDTTTTRKRLRPSEPSSDDEGASRKLQAVGPSSQSEPTQSLPSCVAGAAERPSSNAGGSCNESEFRQVLSKAQKRRQRAAMPQGTAGNIAPPPGIAPATTSASRPPASSSRPGATSAVAPAATSGTSTASLPAPPTTACAVLFRPAYNADSSDCKLWQKEWLLATIKASAPSHLSHREVQVVLRAGPSSAESTGSGPPQAILAGGKTYAAALSTLATELTNSVNHPEAPLQLVGHLASGRKRGCAMTSSFQKKAPQSASNDENTNLRLLSRVVADLLPPDNQQLRSISRG
ncbi:hypothetical protein MTO96_024563 [Rhipicephalus appendiculatus]